MVNSDNVVRGGLTPKLKDVETLMNMMPYEMVKREVKTGKYWQNDEKAVVAEYKTGYDEFRVTKVHIKEQEAKVEIQFRPFSVLVVLEGTGEIEV